MVKLQQKDIILINFSPSIGKEKQGTRPALVLSNANLQGKSSFVWLAPITNSVFYFPAHLKLDKRTKTQGTIHLEQIRSFDFSNRDFKVLEKLPDDLFTQAQEIIKFLIN